ncbi:MAG: DUF2384 domain-containing protein [Gammaproteobacteria bacterium]|nr:DUF2384 domain-containing protein [Gammaproteobacteria bacterium]
MGAGFLQRVIGKEGVEATSLARTLHITKQELAAATGLSRDAVTKTSRSSSVATQGRLRETVEIINRVIPWSGSVELAFAWYRSQPLPSFGDKTAEDLLKEGRGQALRDYLSRIAEGGYA